MKAAVVTIGDEILIGQIIDTNSAWLGQFLNDHGLSITQIISVSDTLEAISAGLSQASQHADLILITGGLGPTKDDKTKLALAQYFDDELIFDPEAFDHIKTFFAKRNREVTELHRAQCYLPSKARTLYNQYGTAPGMHFEVEGKHYISMPGVPYEMKYIVEHGVKEIIDRISDGNHIYHRTIHTAGTGESILSDMILDIQEDLPQNVSLAFLPSLGKVRIRVSGSGNDREALAVTVDDLATQITQRVQQYVFGFDRTSIEQVVGEVCIDKGVTIGTAESCTSGDIARRITSIAGSSQYYHGSVVAYSYELKERLLNVKKNTLETYGAVSEETVREMLVGLFDAMPIHAGIAVSGIAGPGGGTPDKPVGTVWISYGSPNDIRSEKIFIDKNRAKNIEYSGTYALNKLRIFLLDQ